MDPDTATRAGSGFANRWLGVTCGLRSIARQRRATAGQSDPTGGRWGVRRRPTPPDSTTAAAMITDPGNPSPWDAAAYDEWFDAPWGRYAFRIERATLERATGPLDRRRVLDVGCGTGRFTSDLAEKSQIAGRTGLRPRRAQRRSPARPGAFADRRHTPSALPSGPVRRVGCHDPLRVRR